MGISVDEPSVGGSSDTSSAVPTREIFWNLPNTITVLRTLAVPVLLLLPVFDTDRLGSQVIAGCFIVAALTDILDGWLARRGQQVTHIGKLLDPLADKLLVTIAFIVVIALGRVPVWAVPFVVLILVREVAVTSLRAMASAEGVVLGASLLGKWKTGFQIAALTGLAVGTCKAHLHRARQLLRAALSDEAEEVKA